MLRGTGTIGMNFHDWRIAVNNIETKNEAIGDKFNADSSRTQNYFPALIDMLDHLEEVDRLAVRYRDAVTEDISRMRELERRMRERDLEDRGAFMAV